LRLTIDLTGPDVAPDGQNDAAPAAHGEVVLRRLLVDRPAPGELARALWGHGYEEVRLAIDPSRSGLVGGSARVLTALARARRRVISSAGLPDEEVGRLALLGSGTLIFLRAGAVEVATLARARIRARRWAARDPGLPMHAERAASALYLRTDPTLKYMGAYVGGAAAHTTGVINGLIANGVRTTVLAPEPPGGIPEGICVAVPPHEPLYLIGWAAISRYGERIAEYAAARPADFVYQRYTMGSYGGLEAASLLGRPLVLEFNGSEVWVGRNWQEDGANGGVSERLVAIEKRNVLSASLVVVPSDVVGDQLRAWGVNENRILVNPNGVDVGRLAPLRELPPAHWRKRRGLKEAPTVAFIGTFGPWHGATVIPGMAAELAAANDSAQWVLIGDGALRGRVESEIAELGLGDRMVFTGVVPNAQALEYLAAADVCVSPHVPNPDGTRFFGSPTKLFEYMGLGKPIVASDLEQIGEVIVDGHNGLLCAPGNAVEGGAAVGRLLDDAELRGRLGAQALADASERYSWDAHVARILKRLRG
jgi:glycosyltransferase involved in cell wall biosynthesis